MKTSELIILLVNDINNGNNTSFYNRIESYSDTLSKTGNVYHKIKRMLNNKPRRLSLLKEIPRNIKNLIQIKDFPDDNVYLNPDIKALISDLLIEWNNTDIFKAHNIPVRNKILLHGLTGNGKTTIARHIAKVSNLPFIDINSDMIIDCHMGNSGRNIFNIFDQISEPCILFWDEVDTIGRTRDAGSNESAAFENERMVNSMLTNIEKLDSDVIFIGATNRFEVLDSAFVRRFDVKFEIEAPSNDQKKEFINQTANFYKIPADEIDFEIESMNSFSDLKQKLIEVARNFIYKKINK